MKKKHLYALIFIFFIFFAFLLLAEIIVRFRANPERMPVYLQCNGYYLYPYSKKLEFKNDNGTVISVRIDEFGLRNKEGALATAELIILGDSYISALNTSEEDTLSGLLGKNGFSVYNAGVDGFSTFQEYRLLYDLLKTAKPKIVILAFYLGNDFRDNFLEMVYNRDADAKTYILHSPSRINLKAAIKNFFKDSALFRYLYNNVYVGLYRGYFSSLMSSYSLSELESYKLDYSNEMNEAVRKTELAIASMKKLLEARGIRFLILGIPSKAQVACDSSEICNFRLDKRSAAYTEEITKGGYSFDRPDGVLRRIAVNERVEYISLLNFFRSIGAQNIYCKTDSHWNAYGQNVAASVLLKSLAGYKNN